MRGCEITGWGEAIAGGEGRDSQQGKCTTRQTLHSLSITDRNLVLLSVPADLKTEKNRL